VRYQLGDEVLLEILEALPEGRFIVSVDGKLLRTKPILNHIPRAKELIRAKVVSVEPLSFKAVPATKSGYSRDI